MLLCFEMSDISPLLVFTFWQPVYILLDDKEQAFLGKSKEVRGRFVGISEHIGNYMTFKILLDDSNEIIFRSIVCSALDPKLINLCVKPDAGTDDIASSIKKEVNPDADTYDIPPPIKKEALHPVETQRQTRSQTRMHEQLLCDVPPTNAPDIPSSSPPNPDFGSNDPTPDDDSTVPDTFVFMKRDGEKSTKPPIWKLFKVPLLDKNGEQCYNDNGNPITIIAHNPKSLHSTVFLTNPDKHGEIKQA